MGELWPSSYQLYHNGGGRNLKMIKEDATKTARNRCDDRSLALYSSNGPNDKNQYNIREMKTIPSRKSSSGRGMAWWSGPDMKRRKRIAKYKYYAMEGKVKSSIEKGYQWFKTKCSKAMNGL